MPTRFKIKISKTIQEQQFEPYNVTLEEEFDIPSNFTPTEIEETVQEHYAICKNRVVEWIKKK
jgi:hypothetical protein